VNALLSLVGNGLLTVSLAGMMVVSLVAAPPAAGADASTFAARAGAILSHVSRGSLPEPSALTRTVSLYADLPSLMARSGVLVAGAIAIALAIAVPVGIGAATSGSRGHRRLAARMLTTVSSLPIVVWATALLLLSLRLQISFTTDPTLAVLAAITTLVLGDRLLGDLIGRVDQATRELLDEPYMRTVRAAGFSLPRHLAQGLVPPIAEMIASRTLFMVGGAIVVERLFDVRGLGFRVFDALDSNPLERELVVVCGVALVLIGIVARIMATAAAMIADGRRRG